MPRSRLYEYPAILRSAILLSLLFVIGGCGGKKLDVEIAGGGQVVSDIAGIDCPSDCTETFPVDTTVVLSAEANTGFVFSGWDGEVCTGSGLCSITLENDALVSATFVEQSSNDPFLLTVTPSDFGTISSASNDILCGENCSASFPDQTIVSLTAEPINGYSFVGWSGACSGVEACVVQMSQNQTVSAEFIPASTSLSIADMGTHEITYGGVFQYQPSITGNATICRKDIGHDDVRVDSETGAIYWDTSGLQFGRGFHIRIKCSNYTESAYGSLVLHVDRSGSSRLRIAGENGISPYIGVAGKAMSGGDTIVFPDGHYPVSVSGNESYENAFKTTSPTDGTALQYSTIIARTPGGVTISGAEHNGIPKQKNAFQFAETNYVAVVGFVIEEVQRSAVTTEGPGNRLLLDFVGAAGAGTSGYPCSNFSEASQGQCSKAGMRVNQGTPLFQNAYDWGHNRYGIMTRSTTGSITRRSFVRLDEHKGDQPYGGFSNYCDSAHLSQDNTVFDSLAIAAPHYKNYAGLEAYPATGCEYEDANLKTVGLLAVNNELSLSLMDQKAGPIHQWDHIVSYDSVGTCTPQTQLCASLLLQADKETHVTNSFFGQAAPFSALNIAPAFDVADVTLTASVILQNVTGKDDVGIAPQYLPESLLYFRGRSDTFFGDPSYDSVTSTRRWPIGGEDIIAQKMRSYNNESALKVGGGTIHINGNRGAAASDESMSEYFWGYRDSLIPPLVVRVKDKTSHHRVAWEHLAGSRRGSVTGWKVICTSSGNSVLATLPVHQLMFQTAGTACGEYAVIAMYPEGDSGIAYKESPESLSAAVLISEYSEAGPAFSVSQIGNNASGITWHEGLEQYLVVQNNAAKIYRFNQDFEYIGVISKNGNMNSDTEGLAFAGNNQVMIVTEANVAHKATINESTTVINGNYENTPAYRLLPSPISNKGLEGVAFRAAFEGQPARVYACQEGTRSNSSARMKLVYFDMPEEDPVDLMSYDQDLVVVEPFDAEVAFAGVITDCAGMTFDERTGHLILVSQESSKAIQIDPETGSVIAELPLEGAPQYEGVTIGPNGELVFVSEANWIHIYHR